MQINISQKISTYLIIVVLLVGLITTIFLFDKALQADAYSWLQTANKIFKTGDTGFQHRNILYSYLLSVPIFLKLNPINFGLFVSAISLLLSAFLLYKINQKYSSNTFAAYVSFLFIFSYPVLRYGTQLFTDILALFFLISTLYFTIKYYENKKTIYLFIVYLSTGFTVSLRYASVFFIFAFLYFIWITREYYIYHIIGVLISLIPFIPQIIFNLKYLDNIYSLGYAAAHPTLSFKYFVHELKGHNFQILSYIKFLFFDFRGLLFIFTPVCFYGLTKSFKLLEKRLAIYFTLFFVSIIFLLSFYAYFSNRYSIPALIPCFIWVNIGLYELFNRLKSRSLNLLNIYIVVLILAAYGLFDINFQLVQSSRALHEVRAKIFVKLNDFINDEDIVITNEQSTAGMYVNKKIILLKPYQLSNAIFDKYSNKKFYLVKTDKRFTSEDGWDYDIKNNEIDASFSKIYSIEMKPIKELLFYRLLKIFKLEKIIPSEEWHIIKLIK